MSFTQVVYLTDKTATMYNLLTYLEIAAFISSLIAWRVIKKSKYMRLFPLLLFVIAAGELIGYYLAVKYKNNTGFYNFLNPAMHLLYFAIMYFAITGKRFKKFIIAASFVYVIISTVTWWIFCYGKGVFNHWMYILGISILIICLVRKLYELLETPDNMDFLKNPFFYILIFTLLFYTVTIPKFAMNTWITNAREDNLTLIVNNVSRILNFILYGAYTTAFIWIKKTGLY